MKYLRACAICKNYFPPTDWLCSLCWKALERDYLCSDHIYRAEKTLPHLRLLDWHEDSHLIIKPMIHSLKGGGPDFIFRRLGLEMFSRFAYLDLLGKKPAPAFVPAPRRYGRPPDHAYKLAEALSFYFNGKVQDVLTRGGEKESQKRKTKRQRARIEVQKSHSLSHCRTIVFVDDVLTTGATARAAFRALNKPQNFFIFTLAWKRPPEKKEFTKHRSAKHLPCNKKHVQM